MFQTGKPPKEVIREHGLSLISDASSLAAPIAEVLKENPKAIEDFKSGKQAAIGFLVGQVMKKTRGQADPGLVAQELRKKIGQA